MCKGIWEGGRSIDDIDNMHFIFVDNALRNTYGFLYFKVFND